MFDLQAQLDKRLADLRKQKGLGGRSGTRTSVEQIKEALKKSGILSKSGKVRVLTSA
jgi:hypothetical protein